MTRSVLSYRPLRRGAPARWAALGSSGLLACWSLLGPAAALASAGQSAAGADDSRRAVALLQRAARTHQTLAYAGIRVVSAWRRGEAATLIMQVRHLPGQGTSFRVQPGRASASALTYIAAREIQQTGNGAMGGGPLRLLVDNYTVRVDGGGEVAGRRAVVVSARHAGVASARFWIDRGTGVLLRREVFDAQGNRASSSAYLNVRIERPALGDPLPPTLPQPVPPAMSVAALPRITDQGWTCRSRLPGGFALTGVEWVSSPGPAVHSAYSDGLSTVSVFQQRGALDPAALAGLDVLQVAGATVYASFGLPTYLTWQARGVVYTAVTDAPASYVRQVVLSYPHELPEDLGFWQRLWRGLGRLLGWVAPVSAPA